MGVSRWLTPNPALQQTAAGKDALPALQGPRPPRLLRRGVRLISLTRGEGRCARHPRLLG